MATSLIFTPSPQDLQRDLQPFTTRRTLTEDQITDLAVEPIWRVDGRDRRGRWGRWAWELEALGQGGLIRLARDVLEGQLPEPLASVLERQEAEREELRERLERRSR